MATLKQVQEEIKTLRDEQTVIANKIAKLRHEEDEMLNAKFAREFAHTYNKWPLVLDPSDIGYELKNSHLKRFCLDAFGYYTKTKQRCVQVSIYNKDNLDLKIAGLKQVFPHLLPIEGNLKIVTLHSDSNFDEAQYIGLKDEVFGIYEQGFLGGYKHRKFECATLEELFNKLI